jgi:hypothetical protein
VSDQQTQDVADYVVFAGGDAYAIPVEELERFKLDDAEKSKVMAAGPDEGESNGSDEVQGYALYLPQMKKPTPTPYYRDRNGAWQFDDSFLQI